MSFLNVLFNNKYNQMNNKMNDKRDITFTISQVNTLLQMFNKTLENATEGHFKEEDKLKKQLRSCQHLLYKIRRLLDDGKLIVFIPEESKFSTVEQAKLIKCTTKVINNIKGVL